MSSPINPASDTLMAGFGDDVSMSDFRPTQQHGGGEEKEHSRERADGGLNPGGHTSDASVLNVPPQEQQQFSAGGGGGFTGGAPTAPREVRDGYLGWGWWR